MIRRFPLLRSPFCFTAVRRCSSQPSSALLALNDQISKLIVDYDSPKADLNSRMITNADSSNRPWEASCIEVEKKPMRKACAPTDDASSPSTSTAVDDSTIVLYYETHTAEGIGAYRAIAARVAQGQLPGETVNRSAFGFAMWRVSANAFLELNAKPRLKE